MSVKLRGFDNYRILLTLSGFAVLYSVFISRTVFIDQGQVVGTLFDDALISMRFAYNLAMGHGLVWNPSEQPPVEGYTNLLWTLIMSGFLLIFPKTIAPIAVAILGGCILLVCGIFVRKILQLAGAGSDLQIAGMILVLAYFPLVFWTLRGMEVGLLLMLLLWAIAIVMNLIIAGSDYKNKKKDIIFLSLLAGTAFLTRNDSVILFSVVLGFTLWFLGIKKNILPALLPLMICIMAQLAFRYGFYGEFVPNTYVLKMTGVPVEIRILTGLKAFVYILLPIVWPVSIVLITLYFNNFSHLLRILLLLCLAVFTAQSCYLIWVGGDAWLIDYSNRFMAMAVPIILIAMVASIPFFYALLADKIIIFIILTVFNLMLFSISIQTNVLDLGPRSQWVIAIGWLCVIVISAIVVRYYNKKSNTFTKVCYIIMFAGTFMMTSAHAWIRWAYLNAPIVWHDIAFAKQGLMLRDNLPPDTMIAATWLGAPSYFTDLHSIDILGKTDKYIAQLPGSLPFIPGHNKKDLAYSVGKLKPDIVLLDTQTLSNWNYLRLPNGIWLRRDTKLIIGDINSLSSSWCESSLESSYCPH